MTTTPLILALIKSWMPLAVCIVIATWAVRSTERNNNKKEHQ
jgi:hypothetical protein